MTPADLTTARTAMGLSQVQLAEALGVSRQIVWRWEQGKVPIPAWLHLAIAGILAKASDGG